MKWVHLRRAARLLALIVGCGAELGASFSSQFTSRRNFQMKKLPRSITRCHL